MPREEAISRVVVAAYPFSQNSAAAVSNRRSAVGLAVSAAEPGAERWARPLSIVSLNNHYEWAVKMQTARRRISWPFARRVSGLSCLPGAALRFDFPLGGRHETGNRGLIGSSGYEPDFNTP